MKNSEQPLDLESFERVRVALSQAERLLFVTGAGISAESGLPTYRGTGGLYRSGRTEDGLPVEEVLSGGMMQRRPELVWKYLLAVVANGKAARPNAAHTWIASLQENRDVWVLTQNIDGLHQAAGTKQVIDIHNGLANWHCMRCGEETPADWEAVGQAAEQGSLPPRCGCGGIVRPDVVLFGESLPMHKWVRLERELAQGFDLVFSIGTTGVFPYISQPVVELGLRGALTVEINPDRTDLSAQVAVRLACTACEAAARLSG